MTRTATISIVDIGPIEDDHKFGGVHNGTCRWERMENALGAAVPDLYYNDTFIILMCNGPEA